jgi:hypothetical protein
MVVTPGTSTVPPGITYARAARKGGFCGIINYKWGYFRPVEKLALKAEKCIIGI